MPTARPTRKRSKRIQIYLTPSVEKDGLILDVWKAAEQFDRPQDLFRQIVYEGIRALAERGDLPPKVAAAASVDERVGVRKVSATTAAPTVIPVPMPYPQPPAWWQHGTPATHPGFEAHPAASAPAPAPAPVPESVVHLPSRTAQTAPADAPVRVAAEADLPDFLLAEASRAAASSSAPASPAKTRKAASPGDRLLGLMALGE